MQRSNGVMKAVVHGTGIHQMRQPQLRDPAQALNERVIHQIECEFVLNGDESVDRIVQDFVFVVS